MTTYTRCLSLSLSHPGSETSRSDLFSSLLLTALSPVFVGSRSWLGGGANCERRRIISTMPHLYHCCSAPRLHFLQAFSDSNQLFTARRMRYRRVHQGVEASLSTCHTFLFVSRAARGRPHESTSFFMFRLMLCLFIFFALGPLPLCDGSPSMAVRMLPTRPISILLQGPERSEGTFFPLQALHLCRSNWRLSVYSMKIDLSLERSFWKCGAKVMMSFLSRMQIESV
ncbi:hypothetical protein BJY01DRAFT_111669 [Aspergillus pseudoustus]|uniref:Transmembrane protein n=1 Tax=Aspergillus pseudoustus TaxID=1810923 RepID=A0ABR4ISC9_9EURO